MQVTLVRPLKGVDAFSEACLKSTFTLDHPDVEIVFCVASSADPVVPLVQRLMNEHPGSKARLLIGDDRISPNPKLNNMVKGYEATDSAWVAFIDANVLLPPDTVARLFDVVDPKVALVSSPPIGIEPKGWQALTECAILNSYQARWQSCADWVGNGYSQGKVLMFRRDVLDKAGGLKALTVELAEDAAATKMVRDQGYRVALIDQFLPHPIGQRTLNDVWRELSAGLRQRNPVVSLARGDAGGLRVRRCARTDRRRSRDARRLVQHRGHLQPSLRMAGTHRASPDP
jgi:ceramide glucosyltransferase